VTASSVCSVSNGVVSFVGAGTCLLDGIQVGNVNYLASVLVQQSFAVLAGTQALSFTSEGPVAAQVMGPTYTPIASSSVVLPVNLTIDAASSTVCSIIGGIVSFSGAGSCVINADQGGNINYTSAPQLQQIFVVQKGLQALSFTSAAPTSAEVGGSVYVPMAVSTSGLTPEVSVDGSVVSVCSISGGVVSFTGGGSCVLNANQVGDVNFLVAVQVQQIISVAPSLQTVLFTSSQPVFATVGGNYTASATSSVGLPVVIVVDNASVSVCAMSSTGVIFFSTVGTCVVNAIQPGNSNYNASTLVQQLFSVAKGAQTITFTSLPSLNAQVGGEYVPSATASSNLLVTITIDPLASLVCTLSAGSVSFLDSGTCILRASQIGSGNYNSSSMIQQFVVSLSTNNACAILGANCTCTSTVCTLTRSAIIFSTLVVSNNSTLVVNGNLSFTPTSTLTAIVPFFGSIPLLSLTGLCRITGGMLRVVIGSRTGLRRDTQTVTVVSASQVSGQFASSNVTSFDPCINVASSQVVYSSSTISVTLQTTNVCSNSSNSLSIGATVGLVIGSIAGVVLLVAALVLLNKRSRTQRDTKHNLFLRSTELEKLKRMSQKEFSSIPN
jgi:hypothetical protein